MKCTCCNKHIDEVDCACKMCTICGWKLPEEELVRKNEENAK